MVNEADAAALDHPIWSALTSGNRAIALGTGLARRYPPDIAPFAALAEPTPAAYEDLLALLPAEGRAVLFTVDPLTPPPGLEAEVPGICAQMVATRAAEPSVGGPPTVTLGPADVPEMLALVEATRPGPFATRTRELGTYIGIRDGGVLVAMAGERMRSKNHVEVSAVCVHPEYRGRGFARTLITTVMAGIENAGATPFLHTYADNYGAIALYEKLGFVLRRHLSVTVLTRSEGGVDR